MTDLDSHPAAPEIRPATPEDAAEIAAVHASSFVATYPHLPSTRSSAATGLAGRVVVWDRLLRNPGTNGIVLVATDDDGIRGFVHAGASPDDDAHDTGHIFSIHVSPEAKGDGVGGRLMGRAVEFLEQAGFRCATLWVVSDNLPARGFYEQLGWNAEAITRRQLLAVGDEEGDEVEVVRYARGLGDGG